VVHRRRNRSGKPIRHSGLDGEYSTGSRTRGLADQDIRAYNLPGSYRQMVLVAPFMFLQLVAPVDKKALWLLIGVTIVVGMSVDL
jgi:hypothetical protein